MAEELWLRRPENRRKYYKTTKDREPSKLLLKALELGDFKTGLDLGCGAGVDAKEMARRGMEVTAVDINPEVKKFFKNSPVNVVISRFQQFIFKKYDLIFSKSAMVFLPPDDFEEVIEKVKSSLNPGGVCALRLWGKKDSANMPRFRDKRTFVTLDFLRETFEDFNIIELGEIEKDGKTALGKPKHWHFVDIIAQKPLR